MTSHPFLHEVPPGCCKFVLYYAPCKLTTKGITHQLAICCGARTESMGPWCDAHRTGLYEAARVPLSMPEEPRVLRAARTPDRTPTICEMLP